MFVFLLQHFLFHLTTYATGIYPICVMYHMIPVWYLISIGVQILLLIMRGGVFTATMI